MSLSPVKIVFNRSKRNRQVGFKDLLDHMNPYTTVGDIINVVGDRRRFAVGEVSQVMQAISRETEKRLQEGKH